MEDSFLRFSIFDSPSSISRMHQIGTPLIRQKEVNDVRLQSSHRLYLAVGH